MSSNDLLSYSIMNGGNKLNPLSLPPLYLPSINSLPPSNEKVVLPSISSLNRLTESNLINYGSHDHENYKYNDTPSPSNSIERQGSNSNSIISSPKSDDLMQSKRRQRLGPSCDSCRVRKVKCNAEIIMLSNDYKNFNLKEFELTPQQVDDLINYKSISLGDMTWNLILSNEKLIKFKSCNSCHAKHLDCKFSKGFTKEDILVNKKTVRTNRSNMKKKSVDNSRKSSCFNCRKRKIKCTMIESATKCENCERKNSSCHFN